MRANLIADLSSQIDQAIVSDLIDSYEKLLEKHKSGDLQGALTHGGRFVENTLRAIEFIRTGSVLSEIKSVSTTIQQLENKTTLNESLRLLIPRAAYGMIYNLRSKRDAVHVKGIDPTHIDVSLAVAAASWILAELLRLYHVSDEARVAQAMAAISRTTIPYIESIDGETLVSRSTPAKMEILLLLAHSKPAGLARKAIGEKAKCKPPTVTNTLKDLDEKRLIHLSSKKLYFITSTGEAALSSWISENA